MTRLVYFLPAVFLVYVAEANHDFFGKPYELVESCPEYDKLLDAIGIGLVARTGLSFLRPTVTLTHDDTTGYYTLVTQKPFLHQELKFRLGEEFDEVTEEGRSVKSTITMFGNRMLHVQSGRKGLKIERVFGDDEMVATIVYKDIACVRKFAARPRPYRPEMPDWPLDWEFEPPKEPEEPETPEIIDLPDPPVPPRDEF